MKGPRKCTVNWSRPITIQGTFTTRRIRPFWLLRTMSGSRRRTWEMGTLALTRSRYARSSQIRLSWRVTLLRIAGLIRPRIRGSLTCGCKLAPPAPLPPLVARLRLLLLSGPTRRRLGPTRGRHLRRRLLPLTLPLVIRRMSRQIGRV